MNPILKVRDVCLSYHTLSGETPALSHISFDLMPGEFLSIVGPSGCGKSTLLNLIAGLLAPECGSITLDGKPVSAGSTAVGYMLQKDHLLEWRSIYKNILLGLEIRKELTPEKLSHAEELLRIVPRAGDLALQRKPAREARRRVGSDVPARQILERVDVRPVGAGDDERAHRVRGVGRRPRLAGRDAEGLNPLLLHQIDLLGGQHQEVGLLMKHLLGRIRRDDVAP